MKKNLVLTIAICIMTAAIILASCVVAYLNHAHTHAAEQEESEGLVFGVTETPKKDEPEEFDWTKVEKWQGLDGDVLTLSEENYKWEKGDSYVEGTCEILTGGSCEVELDPIIDEYLKEKRELNPELADRYLKDVYRTIGSFTGKEYFLIKEHLDKTVSCGEEIDSIDNVYIGCIEEEQLIIMLLFNGNTGAGAYSPYVERKPKDHEYKEVEPKEIRVTYEIPEGYKVISSDEYSLNMVSENEERLTLSLIEINGRNEFYRYKLVDTQIREVNGKVAYCREQYGAEAVFNWIVDEVESHREMVVVSATNRKDGEALYNSLGY